MKGAHRAKSVVKKHPAETASTGAAAIVTVLLWLFGFDEVPVPVAGALVLIVGNLPAAITWSVQRARGD